MLELISYLPAHGPARWWVIAVSAPHPASLEQTTSPNPRKDTHPLTRSRTPASRAAKATPHARFLSRLLSRLSAPASPPAPLPASFPASSLASCFQQDDDTHLFVDRYIEILERIPAGDG